MRQPNSGRWSGTLDRAAPFYVAGHRGLAGSAIWRALERTGFENLIGRTSNELDLTRRDEVFRFVEEHSPRYVVLAAAKVGGILANSTFPADFISENLQIQTNVLDAAATFRVERLLFLGSSCIYPKFAPQPIPEAALMTGTLEETNDAYAVAKIAGITHVQAVRRQDGLAWISAMPTNLYGPNDNFSLNGSHVLPALIRRFTEAVASGTQSVTNWGTGNPRREFLHVDDMAAACLHLLENYDAAGHVNVGTGLDLTIRELTSVIAEEAGYHGVIDWDSSKPDGTPRKVLDVSLIKSLGWEPRISLREGIAETISWYREKSNELTSRA
ncbi:GDP-L-fucose synthase [Arthrobacter tecti]